MTTDREHANITKMPARRVLRRITVAVLILVALWPGVAVCRVGLAHAMLMRAVSSGQCTSNSDLSRFRWELDWMKSVGPLLKKPWRCKFTLYYADGYAQGHSVKTNY